MNLITAKKLNEMTGLVLVCALDTDVLIDAGAMSLRKDQIDDLPKDTPIVVYCAAWSCSAGKAFARDLVDKRGFTCVYDYVGGLSEWILMSRTRPDVYRLKDARSGEPASSEAVDSTFAAMHHKYFEEKLFTKCQPPSSQPSTQMLIALLVIVYFLVRN